MPKVGAYVTVNYRIAAEVDDDRRSKTYGEVTKWHPPEKRSAQVLSANADGSLELAVYDVEPTKDNHSQLLGGISSATPGTGINQWFQE